MMEIYNVRDNRFAKYGQIIEDYDFSELIAPVLRYFPDVRKGEDLGVDYMASFAPYEETAVFGAMTNHYWAGMPCQFGILNGHNFTMNAREYHRCSEVIVAADDMLLMRGDLRDVKREGGKWRYDTSRTELFVLPAGMAVEMYQTTLHYGPCSAHRDTGYRSVCILPRGVNDPAPKIHSRYEEDKALRGRGTWVIAHPDAPEASDGACVGLEGENLNIRDLLH